MKKIKFLSLLVVSSSLLVGCQKEVKSPSFVRAGDAITFEDLNKAIEEAEKNNAFFGIKEDEHLPSFKMDLEKLESRNATLKRNKKEFSSEYDYSEESGVLKLDTKNQVLEMTSDIKETSAKKTKSTTTGETSKASHDVKIQKVSEDGKNYAAVVDLKEKTYQFDYELDEKTTFEFVLDEYGSMMSAEGVSPFTSAISKYATIDEATKSHYKFYQNKNLFTFEYENTVENETKKSDVLQYTLKTVTNIKAQFDLRNEKKVVVTYYKEVNSSKTYAVSIGDNVAGDVYQVKTANSSKATIVKQNVTVKASNIAKFDKLTSTKY